MGIVLWSTDFITSLPMELKMFFLLVLGIASLSGTEAQDCVAWGEFCDPGSACCGGATCVPNGFGGGFCAVDDTCIAGGYPCLDTSYKFLGSCCQGSFCLPVPGLTSGGGYCVSSVSDNMPEMPAGK